MVKIRKYFFKPPYAEYVDFSAYIWLNETVRQSIRYINDIQRAWFVIIAHTSQADIVADLLAYF